MSQYLPGININLDILSLWTNLFFQHQATSWKDIVERETTANIMEVLFLMIQLLGLYEWKIKFPWELEKLF